MSDKARRYRRSTGRYERLLPTIDKLGGAVETWEQLVVAALLWAGAGSAASHRCAGALWGFDGCPRGPVDITTPRNLRSQDAAHIVIHRYNTLLGEEVSTLGPVDLTAPARTLLDLATVVPPARLEIAMDSALRRRLVTLPELRLTLSLNARRGRRGVRSFRAALAVRDDSYVPPHSPLERKLARLIQEAALPDPLRQYPVIENGREIYRIDFAYPDQMLAIEVDGWEHHSDRISWSKDRRRGNVLTMRGWRVLHFTYEDITKDPLGVIQAVREALFLTL